MLQILPAHDIIITYKLQVCFQQIVINKLCLLSSSKGTALFFVIKKLQLQLKVVFSFGCCYEVVVLARFFIQDKCFSLKFIQSSSK